MQPPCYRKLVGRGPGKAPTECPEAQEVSQGICYDECKPGYKKGVGPTCYVECPQGWRDDITVCKKPKNVNRVNTRACKDDTTNCEKIGALWYPKCPEGYHNVGCCVCTPDCPSDDGDKKWHDTGVDCTKPFYTRGTGRHKTCVSDLEYSVGLCYPKCPTNAIGHAESCFGTCETSQGMMMCSDFLCIDMNDSCAKYMVKEITSAATDLKVLIKGAKKGRTVSIAETVGNGIKDCPTWGDGVGKKQK